MSTEGNVINKSAIRNFAIEARKILIKSAITEAGFYGISKEEIRNPIQRGTDFEVYESLAGTETRIFGADVRRRAHLVEKIRQKGFDEVIEETAYTWFNRLIAIRFMEVNNYLPFRMRVLSSDSGSLTPDIVSNSLDVDLHLSREELDAIQKAKDENAYDEAFRLLFIKACNELNSVLPGLFEKTDDYMELLLKLPYTSDGVVRMLVDTIPESNFNVNEGGQVEIIGWLYQYYNTEPKAKAFAKKGKITKEEIPAVTQLFTPDWIVRYMVENSLGRLWIEHLLANGDPRSEQEIAEHFEWKYYLPEAPQEPEVQAQLIQIREERKDLTPEEILCMDPCQGSGHILVYLFDVLMQIYREEGYSERDAARCILEHNLYGLDIDDRAYQLAYFAVMMKARQYDRMILKKQIQPHVYSIQESNTVNRYLLQHFGADMEDLERNNALNQLEGLLDTFTDAKEYGSILNVADCDWDLLRRFVENDRVEGQMAFGIDDMDETKKQIFLLLDIGQAMAKKYSVAVTNPPYMSVSKGTIKLVNYVLNNYEDGKVDLFTVFIQKCLQLTIAKGYAALITQHAWMFLGSFERMRDFLSSYVITNMAHLGARAFEEISGEVVQTTTFVLRNTDIINYKGTYIRLVDGANQKDKEIIFLSGKQRYTTKVKDYDIIPGKPLAYWANDSMLAAYKSNILYDVARPRQGLATTNNDLFLRLWYEIQFTKIGLGCISQEDALSTKKKWFPVTKGGSFRRWYGNFDYVVNYEYSGKTICDYIDNTPGVRVKSNGRVINRELYFHKGMTWSTIASGPFGMRYVPDGFIFETKGSMCFTSEELLPYLLGLYNSPVIQCFLQMLSPTLDYHEGPLGKTPVIITPTKEIEVLVNKCVELSHHDWDAFETSWDFQWHPLLLIRAGYINDRGAESNYIELSYNAWKDLAESRFNQLKANEEELNRIFIDIYGLQDELTPEVEDKDVTVRKADLKRDIRSFLSYAVGCMFGRYSLDVPGLVYAGGDWKEARTTKYQSFLPDEDAIIPITDEEYFNDDIVARFVDFVRVVYGEETLEENLQFIADALGNKGETSRAVIRNYFLNDFYADHVKIYQKRPIYWLFDSGKENGFKALIYIHRYTPDTVGLIRSVYLHNAQAAIQNSLQNSEYIIFTTTSATERARETRKRDKYMKQLNELRPYYQALSHIALQRIPMDLDEGVKKNYQLFQNVEISTEGTKKQTINLLASM